MTEVVAQQVNLETDTRLLLLSPCDNVFVSRESLSAGENIVVCGENVLISKYIGMGHKLARAKIPVGDKVIKCGVPIGSVVREIPLGAHVHTNNLKSDYTPTFTLDGAKTKGGGR